MNESRASRRMHQPRKHDLREALTAAAETMIRDREALERAREEIEAFRAARRHDHDIARRVPRWVRRIFGA